MRTFCLLALSVAALLCFGTEVKAQTGPYIVPYNYGGTNGFTYVGQSGTPYFIGFGNTPGWYDGIKLTNMANQAWGSITAPSYSKTYGNSGIPLLYYGYNTTPVAQKPVLTFNAYLQKTGYGNLKPNGLKKYP